MTVFNARISVTFLRMIKVLALLLLLYSTTHSPSHTETLDFPTNHFRYLTTVQLLTSIKMHPTYLCPFYTQKNEQNEFRQSLLAWDQTTYGYLHYMVCDANKYLYKTTICMSFSIYSYKIPRWNKIIFKFKLEQ